MYSINELALIWANQHSLIAQNYISPQTSFFKDFYVNRYVDNILSFFQLFLRKSIRRKQTRK
jgi:hypothetical protein